VLDLINHMADMDQEAIKDTRKAADWLYRTGEETWDKLQKGIEAAKDDIQKMMEDIKDEVSKLTGAVAPLHSHSGGTLLQPQELVMTHIMYADAVGSCLPTTHLSTLARMRVKEKQVLVNKDLLVDAGHLHELD